MKKPERKRDCISQTPVNNFDGSGSKHVAVALLTYLRVQSTRVRNRYESPKFMVWLWASHFWLLQAYF